MINIKRILLSIAVIFIFTICYPYGAKNAFALSFKKVIEDALSIGVAYNMHLFFHELGHQLVADEVGAEDHKINFYTAKNGSFYPGLSTYKNIPKKSKLPYATGGERMANYVFEYALQSYEVEPSTFNKALMFFSCADFLAYTILANYIHPENTMYDPNLIRSETGISKGMMLGIVATKSLLNVYRIWNPKANLFPTIWSDKKSVALMVSYRF